MRGRPPAGSTVPLAVSAGDDPGPVTAATGDSPKVVLS
ncbi:hypothetical protein M2164_001325 [Streptomyces sp. SAI-208]|nr:hypothetical protein [Streptomyces sp. SAI-208]